MARLKSCRYCGRIHPADYDCGMRPAYKRGSKQDKYRCTYTWQRKREQIYDRDKYVCRWCLAQGSITYDRLSVHHIEPLVQRPELKDDDINLITLCSACHAAAEAGKLDKVILHSLAASPPVFPK